eukprot:7151906-Ditylum_brightwellii.AAC.1
MEEILKEVLCLCDKKGHRLHCLITLHQHLGEWTMKSPYTAWEYYYSITQDKVYKLHHCSFSIYKAITGWVT